MKEGRKKMKEHKRKDEDERNERGTAKSEGKG